MKAERGLEGLERPDGTRRGQIRAKRRSELSDQIEEEVWAIKSQTKGERD